jgi:UDP-xylose/UDP-N-acetylglucosamine transporter B4
MITAGITMTTIASATEMNSSLDDKTSATGKSDYYEYLRLLIGIAMLTFALFMSARMGLYQEVVYSRYGKHPAEALFYNHALPLPLFLFFASDIYRHIQLFNHSALMIVPYIELAIPKMWVFLLGNVLTQYVCIKSVFILTTECTSLTVTLVITLRKFLSLLVSIAYFDNPFTVSHWVGTVMVFLGTLLFADVFDKIQSMLTMTTSATLKVKKVD